MRRRRTRSRSAIPIRSAARSTAGACSSPTTARSRISASETERSTLNSSTTALWNRSTTCSRGNTSSEPWRRKSARRWDEGLNNSCFVRILFFCRGRTDKVREVEITTQCPECRGDHLVRDYSRAEIVCEDCGLVLDDMIIDEGPEWRAFDSEQRESRERAGPPSTIMAHDKGLSTSIGWRNKDAYGRQIPHKSRAQIYRLRKWQHRIRTSKSGERSLAQGLTEINTMASKMGLPRHVRENAAVLYRRAPAGDHLPGRPTRPGVAAEPAPRCPSVPLPRAPP